VGWKQGSDRRQLNFVLVPTSGSRIFVSNSGTELPDCKERHNFNFKDPRGVSVNAHLNFCLYHQTLCVVLTFERLQTCLYLSAGRQIIGIMLPDIWIRHMTGIRAMVIVSDFTSENINISCVGTDRKRKPK